MQLVSWILTILCIINQAAFIIVIIPLEKKNSNPKGLDQLFPFFRLLLPFFDRSCCYVGSQLKGISCCIIYVFETIATEKNSAEPTRNDHHDVSYIHNLSIRMSLMIIIQKF